MTTQIKRTVNKTIPLKRLSVMGLPRFPINKRVQRVSGLNQLAFVGKRSACVEFFLEFTIVTID